MLEGTYIDENNITEKINESDEIKIIGYKINNQSKFVVLLSVNNIITC